jgi:hypothetical protein
LAFRDITPCGLVHVFEKLSASLFRVSQGELDFHDYSEDVGRKLL